MTEARELIHQSAFDPNTVARMGEAVDAAWAQVSASYANEPQAVVDAARTSLARAVIELASTGLIEHEALKMAALEALKKA